MRLNHRYFLAATSGPALLSASPLRTQTKPKAS